MVAAVYLGGPGKEQLMRGKLRGNGTGVLGGRDRDTISA